MNLLVCFGGRTLACLKVLTRELGS